MNNGFELKRDHPKQKANPISKLLILWLLKLLYTGTNRSLEVLDLYKTLPEDQSSTLADKLETNWRSELSRRHPSLTSAIIKTFIWRYLIIGTFVLIQALISPLQALVLAHFIKQFEASHSNYSAMYTLAGVLLLQSVIYIFLHHHNLHMQSLLGMRIRVAISSLLYRKLLKLNRNALGQPQLLNLLTIDAPRLGTVPTSLHYLLISPIQMVLIAYLLWDAVGISALAGGFSMLLLSLPLQGYFHKLAAYHSQEVAARADERVRLMDELISGIRLLKMYAWERPFQQVVQLARKSEMGALSKAGHLRAVHLSSLIFVEKIAVYVTAVSYVLLGHTITAHIVFPVEQFFAILQVAMAFHLPTATSGRTEALVSIRRLQGFLLLDERVQAQIEHHSSHEITINNVTTSTILKELDLMVPAGSLCAVVGPVGAGKSLLLHLLLGQAPLKSGQVSINENIAYASQEPWIFASNVRNNILFGLEYNKAWYRQVVKACALDRDFQQLPQGDKTVVGERGVALCGGQRARIGLARAVYRQAGTYLLDDPLATFDAHVGKHLFEECIIKQLRGKTRVLVTHQWQHLKRADMVIVLNNGQIEARGTFEDLSQGNVDLGFLVTPDEGQEREEVVERRASIKSIVSLVSEISEADGLDLETEEDPNFENSNPFCDYVKVAGNCCTILAFLVVLVLAQVACNSTDYWLAFWTTQEAVAGTKMANDSLIENPVFFHAEWFTTGVAIHIYTGLVLATVFLTLIRSLVAFKMAMVASISIHNQMFGALLYAPMRFFDLNPTARILNRFSKDMGTIDAPLPKTLMDAAQTMLVMTGILVLVSIANWYFVIAVILIAVLFVKVNNWFIAAAKDIKHLEGLTKSHVILHLTSSLDGLTTIGASKAEEVLRHQFDHHLDNHTSAWCLTIALKAFFGLWLDLIAATFMAVVAFSFILLHKDGQLEAGIVGLAISQVLRLTGMLQSGMCHIAEVVHQLSSVDRALQYAQLEREGVETLRTRKSVPRVWPSSGHIRFKNVSLKYSDSDPAVLKNLHFDVKPGEKIGIVGRTGAGKTSLVSALFRLAPLQGSVTIDGTDTKSIALGELRRKITIIAREPVLFSGSLRRNLDPVGEFGDEELWRVLDEVGLKSVVASLDEGGGGWSVGQKQLVCLARAILRGNRILVVDEATANVDPETGDLIEAIIRAKFGECTVLTIAHRLDAIMDADKVLVMSFGHLVEYDHPHVLLQNPDGAFSKLVAETGMTQQLTDISHEDHLTSIKE